MADEAHRLRVREEWESADRALHERLESNPVGRQRGRGVLPRDAIEPARMRLGLVAAEEHPAVLGLAVHEIVRVTEARHVARELMARDGLQRDVLVIDRGRRDERTDHLRDARRPHPGRIHDELRVDGLAILEEDSPDLAPRPKVEARDARVLADTDAEPAGGIGECECRRVRVEVTVARQVYRAKE